MGSWETGDEKYCSRDCCAWKSPGDQQFLRYWNPPVWHQQSFCGQSHLDHIVFPHSAIWTEKHLKPLDHVCLLLCHLLASRWLVDSIFCITKHVVQVDLINHWVYSEYTTPSCMGYNAKGFKYIFYHEAGCESVFLFLSYSGEVSSSKSLYLSGVSSTQSSSKLLKAPQSSSKLPLLDSQDWPCRAQSILWVFKTYSTFFNLKCHFYFSLKGAGDGQNPTVFFLSCQV